MKKSSATISLSFDARRANLPRIIVIVIALSVVLGMLLTDTIEEMSAYLLLALVSSVPVALWIWNGGVGIPILPSISVMYFIYYAVPILRKNAEDFGPSEILSAAVTVALFLTAATISWWLLLVTSRQRSDVPKIFSGSVLERIMFLGLVLGVFYHVALYTGWLYWLGPAFGAFRSSMLTTATAACFMLGHARAQGSLRGRDWVLAVTGLGLMVILSWASLFLVNGMTYCLAAVFGYVITSRRVPWIFLLVAIAVIIIFHAGKESMRDKYWYVGSTSYGTELSVTRVPALMAEWVGTGLTTIASNESYSSAIDRASLLNLLLRVQRLTPDYLPALEGKTYAFLPQMLVPRFIDPDKITSQEAMKMLNVYFGFQTVKQTQDTAVGWGLITEAYANFGRFGVFAVALLWGALCGSIERWSLGAPPISLPGLVAVVTMIQMLNVELDVAGLLTALFQSVAVIAMVFWLSGTLSKHRRPPPQRINA